VGIYDRDYWKDRGETRRSATARKGPSTSWRPWLLWFGILVSGALAARLLLDVQRAPPFPLTGQVHWYVAEPDAPTAPLTLLAPPNSRTNFVVRFDRWEDGRPVAIVPIRAGEEASVQMPLGRYRMTILKGYLWQGSAGLFRFTTDARQVLEPVDFYRVGNQINGRRIQLETFGGNMPTGPALTHR